MADAFSPSVAVLSVLGSPLRGVSKEKLLPVMTTAIVCANVITLALGALAYANLRLAVGVLWPALWALLCAVALWPIKTWIVDRIHAVQSADVGVVQAVLWLVRIPFRLLYSLITNVVAQYQLVAQFLLQERVLRIRERRDGWRHVGKFLSYVLLLPSVQRRADAPPPGSDAAAAAELPADASPAPSRGNHSLGSHTTLGGGILSLVHQLAQDFLDPPSNAPPSRQQLQRSASEFGPDASEPLARSPLRFADGTPTTAESALWMLLFLSYVAYAVWGTVGYMSNSGIIKDMLGVMLIALVVWVLLASVWFCCTRPSMYASVRAAFQSAGLLCRNIVQRIHQSHIYEFVIVSVMWLVQIGDRGLTKLRHGVINSFASCAHPLAACTLILLLLVLPAVVGVYVSASVITEWSVAYTDVREATSQLLSATSRWTARTDGLTVYIRELQAAVNTSSFTNSTDQALNWYETNVSNDTRWLRTSLDMLQHLNELRNRTQAATASNISYVEGDVEEVASMAGALQLHCNMSVAEGVGLYNGTTWQRWTAAGVLFSHHADARSLPCAVAVLEVLDVPGASLLARWLQVQAASSFDAAGSYDSDTLVALAMQALKVTQSVASSGLRAALTLFGGFWAIAASAAAASASFLTFLGEFFLFLNFLFYLLCLKELWIDSMLKFFLPPASREVVQSDLFNAVRQVFSANLKICLYNGLLTWLMLTAFDVHLAMSISIGVAIGSVFPIPIVNVLLIPAAIEIAYDLDWGGYGLVPAAVLYVVHGLACSYVQFYMFESVKNSHPAVLGLSLLAGIAAFGWHGALLGPILVCMLVGSYNLAGRAFASTVSAEADGGTDTDAGNIALAASGPRADLFARSADTSVTSVVRSPPSMPASEMHVGADATPALPPAQPVATGTNVCKKIQFDGTAARSTTPTDIDNASIGAGMSPPPTVSKSARSRRRP